MGLLLIAQERDEASTKGRAVRIKERGQVQRRFLRENQGRQLALQEWEEMRQAPGFTYYLGSNIID